jgi:hypothetical protein
LKGCLFFWIACESENEHDTLDHVSEVTKR